MVNMPAGLPLEDPILTQREGRGEGVRKFQRYKITCARDKGEVRGIEVILANIIVMTYVFLCNIIFL